MKLEDLESTARVRVLGLMNIVTGFVSRIEDGRRGEY